MTAGRHRAARSRNTGRPDTVTPDLSEAARNRRFRRNVAWNYGSGATSVVALVILYPVAVALAGPERYGLWVLVFGATQLLSFADFGMGDSVVRQLGDLLRTGTPFDELRRFVTVALSIFGTLALLLGVLFLVGVPLYLTTIPLEAFTRDEILWVVLAGAWALVNAVIARAMNAVLWAYDRQDIERKSNVTGVLLRTAGFGVVAWAGGGLSAVVAAEVAGSCVSPVVCSIVVARMFGAPDFAREGFRRYARNLVRLGATLFVGSLALVVSFQVPLYIVGSHLGLLATTAFGALTRLYQSARLVNSWMANPFIHMFTTAPREDLLAPTRRSIAFTGAIGVLVALVFAGLPEDLTVAWLGEEFAFAATATAVIGIGVIADAVIRPITLLVNLRGSPRRMAVLNVLNLVGVVVATTIAVRTDSLMAVMLASVVVPALLAPVYVIEARRVAGAGVLAMQLRALGSVVLGVAALGGSLVLIGRALPPWPAVGAAGLLVAALGAGAFTGWRRRRGRAAVGADGAKMAESSRLTEAASRPESD